MSNWDVIVLGLGGVGSAAAFHLASAGQRVLGIDTFTPPHDRGSSHGKLRVIRQAYFEHPAYVPLLRRAYQLWDELQTRSGSSLFQRTGLVEVGPADGVVIPGVLRSAREHGLSVESLSMSEVSQRWPGLDGRPDWQAVLEKDAGFLRVEDCLSTHLRLAVENGAVCRHGQTVTEWRADGTGVRVTTREGVETASSLIIAAGPWAATLLNEDAIPLRVLRKHQYWFDADGRYELNNSFPCFFFETDGGYFYGFPSVDAAGVKVARHSGGEPLDGPDRNREIDPSDHRQTLSFMKRCLPGVSDRLKSHASCFYTMTPDEHFVIDRLPDYPQVTVIAGLSGHGFKFTSVLGEIASRLAVGADTEWDLSLFAIDRCQGT